MLTFITQMLSNCIRCIKNLIIARLLSRHCSRCKSTLDCGGSRWNALIKYLVEGDIYERGDVFVHPPVCPNKPALLATVEPLHAVNAHNECVPTVSERFFHLHRHTRCHRCHFGQLGAGDGLGIDSDKTHR